METSKFKTTLWNAAFYQTALTEQALLILTFNNQTHSMTQIKVDRCYSMCTRY